jgi:hypothetical protein
MSNLKSVIYKKKKTVYIAIKVLAHIPYCIDSF